MEVSEIKAIDKVLPTILKAVADWQTTNTKKVISEKVVRTLDAKSNEVMLKLLGFKDSWGEWELDHCNGRSGNSAAGDFLRKVQQNTIEEWLTSNLLPALAPALKAKLKKEFQREYADKLFYAVRTAAQTRADKDAIGLINNLAETDDLAKYLQAIQLLNPEKE